MGDFLTRGGGGGGVEHLNVVEFGEVPTGSTALKIENAFEIEIKRFMREQSWTDLRRETRKKDKTKEKRGMSGTGAWYWMFSGGFEGVNWINNRSRDWQGKTIVFITLSHLCLLLQLSLWGSYRWNQNKRPSKQIVYFPFFQKQFMLSMMPSNMWTKLITCDANILDVKTWTHHCQI